MTISPVSGSLNSVVWEAVTTLDCIWVDSGKLIFDWFWSGLGAISGTIGDIVVKGFLAAGLDEGLKNFSEAGAVIVVTWGRSRLEGGFWTFAVFDSSDNLCSKLLLNEILLDTSLLFFSLKSGLKVLRKFEDVKVGFIAEL